MNHTLLILSIFLISIRLNAQKFVTVYGNISNSKSEKVYVRYFKDYLTYEMGVADSATLDKKGNFSMRFAWKKPYPASFQLGDETTDLFLTPTDSCEIVLDANKFDESIKYRGKGAIENNYLAQKTLRNAGSSRKKAMASKSMEEKKYTLYIDSAYAEEKSFFKKYFSAIPNKAKSVIDFMKTEEENIIYSWASDKMRYPSFHRYYNNLKENVEVSEKYYDFLSQINLNNPKAISSSIYLQYLDNYIHYQLQKALKNDTTLKENEKYLKAEEEFVEKTFTDEVKNVLIAKKIYYLIVQQGNIEQGKKMLDKYTAASKNKEYFEILNDVYSVASKLAPGNPAPEFSYPDINGKMVSLMDFRGKVVYLDVWASWCGPCLKEIPEAKKLEEEMKGKNVIFLCVSIDRDENAWKKMLKEKEMTGIHLICKGDFDSEISKLYNVKGIPRYILIAKNGKIINSNANRPSSNAKADIEKLLN